MYVHVCMYVWMDAWMDGYVCMYVCVYIQNNRMNILYIPIILRGEVLGRNSSRGGG